MQELRNNPLFAERTDELKVLTDEFLNLKYRLVQMRDRLMGSDDNQEGVEPSTEPGSTTEQLYMEKLRLSIEQLRKTEVDFDSIMQNLESVL